MCPDKHQQYEISRSTGQGAKPRGFKPTEKTEKPDMASQISGEAESKDSE
jgi:hypothetical protein